MIYEKNGIRYTVYSDSIYGVKNNQLSERKEKEMKEAYEVAEMEIIEFETEDVITSSGEIGGGDEGFGD